MPRVTIASSEVRRILLALLAQPEIFAAWLRPLFRQDWVVYLKRPFGGPEYVLQYLGRYTHRVAISNHRGRVRERLGLPVSVRCRERGVSRVAHLPRPQDLESADSTKVVTCAVFALPPSDFPLQRPRRSSEDVVIPFPLPMLEKHCSKFNKVCFNGVTTIHRCNLTR